MEADSSTASAYQPPASPSQVRFSQTPPESPKSCMKGSRRLTFSESGEAETSGGGVNSNDSTFNWRNQPDSSYTNSPKSPRKSAKIVMIKSPGSGSTSTPTGMIGGDDSDEGDGLYSGGSQAADEQAGSSSAAAEQLEPEQPVEFQFHLSQHYETSPVLPNCTSNGSYEEYQRQKEEQERLINKSDSFNETTSFSFETSHTGPNQYDPQLVEIATKFVNEIIEKAKQEVVNRQKAEGKQRSFSFSANTLVDRGREMLRSTVGTVGNGAASNLLRRAKGTISGWVTNVRARAQSAVNVKT